MILISKSFTTLQINLLCHGITDTYVSKKVNLTELSDYNLKNKIPENKLKKSWYSNFIQLTSQRLKWPKTSRVGYTTPKQANKQPKKNNLVGKLEKKIENL